MSNDIAADAIYQSLRGLAQRQRVIAGNIANINTPNYLAGRVNFENSLARAVQAGDPAATTDTATQSKDPTGIDGNNVNLDDETISMTETNLRYSTMLEAMNAKFRLLRTAMG